MTGKWEQAVQQGDFEQVGRLVSEGADVNSKDRHGQTALMVAATQGYTAVVKILVQSKAELDEAAKYNLTALMLAVLNGHTEIVRILMKAGADTAVQGTGAPGFSGKTALQLAEDAGRSEIEAILRNTS
jgi:ankyrin repeat protein